MPEMTSETNATPSALSKLATLIAHGAPVQPIAVSEAIQLCVSAWEADIVERDELRGRVIERMQHNRELNDRIAELEKEQRTFVAMLCHNHGGEIRVMPVLLRGDEELLVWDDPLTMEKVYRLKPAILAGKEKP